MLKTSDIRTLLDAAPPLGVSIFLPTHVRGAEIRQDPIRLKTLVAEARDKLGDAGVAPDRAEALLAPAAALVEDYAFWQHQNHGLALFLGAGAPLRHHLPVPVPECVVVGPGFHVRPLLNALAAEDVFLLLTITADRVRLFEASRFGLREDPEAGLPRSLAEAMGEDADYEAPQQASPANRPQVGANSITQAQVQGDSPEEWRKRRMVAFLHRVAAAMDARMAGDRRLVVVAADAQAQGHFRGASRLGAQLAGVIEVNPEALDRDALHAAALGVLEPRFEARRQRAAERLEARLGSADGRVALELPAILDAARIGRVSTLLLAQDGDGVDGSGGNALDASTAGTLQHGGDVRLLPNGDMPEGVAAAALLRY